ncbi:AcrR family transcriptional regulator [Variovorax paradoxus]|uniref:TetR/AcrR family transcriptional regulator n=1 Tax=Variovorax paradoxus TaxID=34073 RepID=UPI002787ED80|nr:helix-turn-helix domain-containing protein [Variovorax paradoxus]MDP9962910.1 AcrR family transcriptional regulator [Variovorax paradoxus]
MSSPTRDKMIAGAADLLSRRGVHATSLRTVVQHTGTPRGSLGHHFPGGKQQLLEEAVRHANESVAVPLETLMKERGAVEGLQAFVGWWRRILESSGFEAGCPVLAVAVEPMADEEDAASGEQLRELAHEAFERWEAILAAALRREGVAASRAQRLGALTVAAIEGTVAMCRAARSTRALDDVQLELKAMLMAATAR